MTPLVFDNVLPDALAYRAACLAQPFRSHELAQDVVFHGIGQIPDRSLPDWIEARYPGLAVVTSLTRLSPLGQSCPNFVHTDTDMGEVTGIFYLNPQPLEGDGTAFYANLETGREESAATTTEDRIAEGFAWRDLNAWEHTQTVAARFNRLVLFPAGAYHSRAIFENYGATTDDARLIQIAFCTGVIQ
jgi:hypothetical protein